MECGCGGNGTRKRRWLVRVTSQSEVLSCVRMDPRIGFEIRAGRSFDFISSSGADRREEEKRSNPASDSH